MSFKPIEYEFTMPDGSKVYEIVYELSDVWAFTRAHKAVASKPVKAVEART